MTRNSDLWRYRRSPVPWTADRAWSAGHWSCTATVLAGLRTRCDAPGSVQAISQQVRVLWQTRQRYTTVARYKIGVGYVLPRCSSWSFDAWLKYVGSDNKPILRWRASRVRFGQIRYAKDVQTTADQVWARVGCQPDWFLLAVYFAKIVSQGTTPVCATNELRQRGRRCAFGLHFTKMSSNVVYQRESLLSPPHLLFIINLINNYAWQNTQPVRHTSSKASRRFNRMRREALFLKECPATFRHQKRSDRHANEVASRPHFYH